MPAPLPVSPPCCHVLGKARCAPEGPSTCSPDLLPPLRSYLAIPASSWVDDFIDWLTPSSCCRIYAFGPNKDEFCPSTVSEWDASA